MAEITIVAQTETAHLVLEPTWLRKHPIYSLNYIVVGATINNVNICSKSKCPQDPSD